MFFNLLDILDIVVRILCIYYLCMNRAYFSSLSSQYEQIILVCLKSDLQIFTNSWWIKIQSEPFTIWSDEAYLHLNGKALKFIEYFVCVLLAVSRIVL